MKDKEKEQRKKQERAWKNLTIKENTEKRR
jgi:hypothetical protein